MTTTFYQLPIGARFEFRGRRYLKQALAMACDEDRCGNIFQEEAEVVWERRPGEELRPPRPPEPPWTTHLRPAPGPGPRRKVEGGGLRVERRNGHLTPALSPRGGEVGAAGAACDGRDTWK